MQRKREVDIIIPTKLIHDGEMPELIYSKTEDMPRGVGYFCPQQEFAARRQGLQCFYSRMAIKHAYLVGYLNKVYNKPYGYGKRSDRPARGTCFIKRIYRTIQSSSTLDFHDVLRSGDRYDFGILFADAYRCQIAEYFCESGLDLARRYLGMGYSFWNSLAFGRIFLAHRLSFYDKAGVEGVI